MLWWSVSYGKHAAGSPTPALQIARYYDGVRILTEALRLSFTALMVPLFFLTIIALIFASVVYFLEREVNPDQFNSIPQVRGRFRKRQNAHTCRWWRGRSARC